MFGDINSVQIMGNVTSDVECKYTPSGAAVLNFSVATNRSYKQNEEWKEEATYHNITLWRNADKVAERIKKGTRIHIEGRLTTRSWQKDGETKYRTEILAERVILIDRYNKFSDSEPPIEAYEHDNSQMVENEFADLPK